MASDKNNFSKTEGGAMLSPNTEAQPSFDNEDIEQQETDKPTDNQNQINNGSELDGTPEKELAKVGAKKALETTGIPSGVADDIVKKADENGAIDKVATTIKKKKKSIIAAILSSLIPFLMWFVFFIVILAVFLAILQPLMNAINFINNLFTTPEEAAQYIQEIDDNNLTGKLMYQTHLSQNLPDKSYFSYLDSNNVTSEEKEIEKMSKIVAGIMASAVYYDSLINEITLGNLETSESGYIYNEEIVKFFARGLAYKLVTNDACMLAYAGLKSSTSGKSYYEDKGNGNYKSGWDEIAKNECNSYTDSWQSDKTFIDNKLMNYSNSLAVTVFANNYRSSLSNIKNENKNNAINDKLKEVLNKEEYEFDSETYEKFIKEYYAERILDKSRYEDFINQFKTIGEKERKQILSEVIAEDISADVFAANARSNQESLVDEIKKAYEGNNESGSGLVEETVINKLLSPYGQSKCAILEEYNPLTHEYVVSKSTENDEIYSVSDGEVVSVTYNGDNIYSKYDSSSGKCLCNGIECENSNGSEIEIKFIYDEIEYMVIYSHLAEIRVDVGDKVKAGDIIATEGDSGCTNTKKLSFKLVSENGISYNTNELVQKCSSFTNTASLCNFQNIKINLHNCNDELIKTFSFYDYIKEEIYSNFKSGINNNEFLKAAALISITKVLNENNYKIGTTEIEIKKCDYKELKINIDEYEKLDKAVSSVMGQVIMYAGKFANVKYSSTCTRTDKDKNANSVYNELCINEAIKLANSKTYGEILKIYYPSFYINDDYCYNYASKINAYVISNSKPYLTSSSYSEEAIEKLNEELKNKIDSAKLGTRASAVEAARFLSLGLKYKIPYKNNGKYLEEGINPKWYLDGLDSSGFISWVLKNGGITINESMSSRELVNNNVVGSLKITSTLYNYYDKIQVGDFAYSNTKLGFIIGKSDGILYVAEESPDNGLIVTKITSYGESDSKYTHIYYADDYYNGVGNITSMW